MTRNNEKNGNQVDDNRSNDSDHNLLPSNEHVTNATTF